MASYAAGDGEAFQELFRRYEGRAYGFMLRRVRPEARAADLYQELFLRIHRARSSYDPSRPFAPWFFEIARRLVIDERRHAFRWREQPLPDEANGEPAIGFSVAGGAEQSIADRQGIHTALAQLSGIERHVLIAAKVDGRSYAELALELGKSVVAIKKLASRAMQRLRSAAAASAMPARS